MNTQDKIKMVDDQIKLEIAKLEARIAAKEAETQAAKQFPPTRKPDNGPALATVWESLTDTERGYLYAYGQAVAQNSNSVIKPNVATLPFMRIKSITDMLKNHYYKEDPFLVGLLEKLK